MPISPEELRSALQAPLPGYSSFAEFSGYPRPNIEEALRQDPPLRESAVLILIHPAAGVDRTLLMRRPVYQGVHSGQIGFPGGKREAGDIDLVATALREFGEETGGRTDNIQVVGQLTRIPIPPSRTLVTPMVGWAPQLGDLQPDQREVAALLDVPLSELLRPDILRRKTFRMGLKGEERMAAYWDIRGEVVWGATAMMIAELRAVLARF